MDSPGEVSKDAEKGVIREDKRIIGYGRVLQDGVY